MNCDSHGSPQIIQIIGKGIPTEWIGIDLITTKISPGESWSIALQTNSSLGSTGSV